MNLCRWAIAALTAGPLLVAPASAFDCAKAATRTEKAICADKELKKADDALAAAYDSVLKRTPPSHLDMLRSSQRAWLTSRDEDCAGDAPDDTQADLFAFCVLDHTNARTDILSPTPQAGPGLSTPLTPIFVWRKETDAKSAADLVVYEFGAAAKTPGMMAFDARVDALLTQFDSDYGGGDADPRYTSYYDGVAQIAWASDDILSVSIPLETFTGGAHPNTTATAILMDLKAGKVLAWGDVFGESAKKPLADACFAAIKESSGRSDDVMNDYAATIANEVTNFNRWTVTPEGATVYFPPYEIGGYAEGPFSCDLAKDLLQKAAGKRGWIVP